MDPDTARRLREQGTIKRSKAGRFTVYTVNGKNTTDFLRTVYDTVLGTPGNVALEIEQMDVINSAIVGLLMALARQISKANRKFCLLRPSGKLTDMLTITATLSEIEIVESLEELEQPGETQQS